VNLARLDFLAILEIQLRLETLEVLSPN
jgi:hypothetical protein